MPLDITNPPRDHVWTNAWTIEINGVEYHSIDNVSLPGRSQGSISRGHGPTGIMFKFPNHHKEYGPSMTLRRVLEKDENGKIVEDGLSEMVAESMERGTKYDAVITKYDEGRPIFKINILGLLFTGESNPSLAKDSAGVFTITYTCQVDWWERVNL